MMRRPLVQVACACALIAVTANSACAQSKTVDHALDNTKGLRPLGVHVEAVQYNGRVAVHVVDPPSSIEGNVVLLPGTEMLNGTIDVDVAGKPAREASADVRGFVGVAFRVQPDSSFEAFYIRATNGRADDPVRRSHATQYIASPEYTFDRLRTEQPGQFESYTDLEVGAWTHIRIELADTSAKFFVNGAATPTLVVNRLLGKGKPGPVALWIGDRTDGYYSQLKVAVRP